MLEGFECGPMTPRQPCCEKCEPDKSCGLRHVYVIELEKEALDMRRKYCRDLCVARRDEIRKGEGRCFYVGQTKCSPYCRYTQHVGRGRNFECRCETGEPKRLPRGGYRRGNAAVKKYHKPDGLRPALFADLNPIRGGQGKALEAEKKLAEELRAQGHAVHYN
jgi:hypothetical protein